MSGIILISEVLDTEKLYENGEILEICENTAVKVKFKELPLEVKIPPSIINPKGYTYKDAIEKGFTISSYVEYNIEKNCFLGTMAFVINNKGKQLEMWKFYKKDRIYNGGKINHFYEDGSFQITHEDIPSRILLIPSRIGWGYKDIARLRNCFEEIKISFMVGYNQNQNRLFVKAAFIE